MNSSVLSEDDMSLEIMVGEEYRKHEIVEIEVFTSRIANKTQISEIVDYLSKTIAFKDLNHLKRIKSKDNCFEVIICINNDNSKPLLKDINDFLLKNNLLPLKITNVPKNVPKNRIQYELSAKMWPINYHPNKYMEKCLNSSLFDSKARKIIFDLISKVIEKKDKCVNQKQSMVTLVTDSSHKILTINESEVASNPLRHSVLVAIDHISRLQTNDTKQELDKNMSEDSYLCTGYDIYMSDEPCIMCCMALVHSRIRRLYFLNTNNNLNNNYNDCCDKAITLHNFHLLPKLNHHFECWKISFK